MKSYEIRDAFGVDALTAVSDRPDPKPGPGQVVVSVRAVSLNFRDLLLVRGEYNPKLRLPMTPCSDCAGEVAAVGDGVTRVKVGDRVAGIFMQTWLDGEVTEAKAKSALGGAIGGVLSEQALLHENGLVHIPAHLSFEEARVISTSSSGEKLARLCGMGASDGINYKTTPDWDKRVRELTGGAGAHHIVEVGGANTLPKSLKAVRMGGRISLIGNVAGAGEVNPVPLLMKNVRMQGIFVGSREMFEAMNRAITTHSLRPVVDRVFPFDQVREALHYMESGAQFGKICIKVS